MLMAKWSGKCFCMFEFVFCCNLRLSFHGEFKVVMLCNYAHRQLKLSQASFPTHKNKIIKTRKS